MFCIKIAGLVIQIKNQYSYIRNQCRRYVVHFRKPDFIVEATMEELLEEQGGSEQYSLDYCESLCIYRHIAQEMLRYDALLMHAAIIAVDGQAYAFAAQSGTGKTTHIRLWRKLLGRKVKSVNGDKPILRFEGDTLYAYGTPWAGKENLEHKIRRPLKAICFLERGKENRIRKMSADEAIGCIFHQLLIPDNEEDAERFFALVDRMLSTVNFYVMQCNMELEAAQVAYEEMRK